MSALLRRCAEAAKQDAEEAAPLVRETEYSTTQRPAQHEALRDAYHEEGRIALIQVNAEMTASLTLFDKAGDQFTPA